MTEIQMTKTKKLLEVFQPCLALFRALDHSKFGFVSDFGIRISNLLSETQLPTGIASEDRTSEADGLIALISRYWPMYWATFFLASGWSCSWTRISS